MKEVEDDGEGGGEGRLCGTVALTQQAQSRETDLCGQEVQECNHCVLTWMVCPTKYDCQIALIIQL